MAHAGQLLLATPGMHEATFERTVILLLDHDDASSMGLVLNRPSTIAVSDALPDLAHVAQPNQLFLGGPVEQGTALVLAEAEPESTEFHLAHHGVGLVDLSSGVAVESLKRARVFIGYAGWGPQQLRDELRAGAWLLADPVPGDLWSSSDVNLWATIFARLGDLSGFFARYPQQPWLN